MKMRKLFAGIAAAATLLGGMALGATSAQADDAAGTPVTGEATFTFTAETAEQLTNAKLKARLAIMFSMVPARTLLTVW